MAIFPKVTQHLVQNEERDASANEDEEYPANQDHRTIATGVGFLRALRAELGLEDLQELFWR